MLSTRQPMSLVSLDSCANLRPPAPVPRPEPLGPFALLKALRNNPLETWTRVHFERPIVTGGRLIGEVAIVMAASATRLCFLRNAGHYHRESRHWRMLSAV